MYIDGRLRTGSSPSRTGDVVGGVFRVRCVESSVAHGVVRSTGLHAMSSDELGDLARCVDKLASRLLADQLDQPSTRSNRRRARRRSSHAVARSPLARRLAALRRRPSHQLDRRRHHARRSVGCASPPRSPCRRARSARTRRGRELHRLAAASVSTTSASKRLPISAPPRQTSPSSSLMPITPLPDAGQDVDLVEREVDDVARRRRQEHALLVARAPSPSPPCRPRPAGRSAGRPSSRRCGTAPAASAAPGPAPSPPADTARPARRSAAGCSGGVKRSSVVTAATMLHLVGQRKNLVIGSP